MSGTQNAQGQEYDEDVNIDDDDTFRTPSSFEYDATLYTTPSPRRKTRSCATPDVLKTLDGVTLDDLLRHSIIKPGAKLTVEGVTSNGILLKDGWIEFGADKYPDLEAWVLKLKKRNRTLRHSDKDCWEVVSAKGNTMSFFRDQLLELLAQHKTSARKKDKKEPITPTKADFSTPKKRRTAQAKTTPVPINTETSEDGDVLIEDEPNEMVLPHKKRKVMSSGDSIGYNESSSLVDLLANLEPGAEDNISSQSKQIQGKKAQDSPPQTPPSDPTPAVSPELTSFQPSNSDIPSGGDQSPAAQSPSVISSFHKPSDFHTISSTELGALAAHLDEHAKEVDSFEETGASSIAYEQAEKVILGTGMKSQMLVTLQTLVEQLGGKLTHDFSEAVTHVVTIADGQGHTPRTLKYCSAVLNGAWILSFDWILASLAAKSWADEAPYEIKGDQHNDSAPLKARTSLSCREPRLFAGKSFYFVGGFNHPSPSRAELEALLRIGGATILSAPPPLPSSVTQYMETNNSTLVVCDPSSFTQKEAVEVQMGCSLIPISYSWILDSISAYQLNAIDSYKFLPDNIHNFETQQSLAF